MTPATPDQIRTRRGISAAPTDRAVLLMWQDDEFTWQAIPGQWREECGWIADPVVTGSPELPAVPTHWSKA